VNAKPFGLQEDRCHSGRIIRDHWWDGSSGWRAMHGTAAFFLVAEGAEKAGAVYDTRRQPFSRRGDGSVSRSAPRMCIESRTVKTLLVISLILGTLLVSACSEDSDAPTAAQPRGFVDHHDGTISDLSTGLMWEKKVKLDRRADDLNLHDADNCYPWEGGCETGGAACRTDEDCGIDGPCRANDCQAEVPNGKTVFQWVEALNAANFAGHSDWCIPTVQELESIVDHSTSDPTVDVAFNGAKCGTTCTDMNDPACSCTGSSESTWSSTYVNCTSPIFGAACAWALEFFSGTAAGTPVWSDGMVRAVRDDG
jgi:hypothetical protein